MKYLISALMIIVFGLISAGDTFATTPSSISVNITPTNPAPFEDVTISLNSFSNNLDSVSISWFTNGGNVSSGIGRKSYSLKAPVSGAQTTVRALIALPEGNIEKNIVIKPNSMVLIWQANDSYVPPFYRGKALPSLDSEIKVVAMPEVKIGGSMVSSKNMTYAWKKDYTNDVEGSGYGKNFFIYTNDYLENSNNVSVVASTVDQKYLSEANVTVGTTEPKIVFYKNDNNAGVIWDRALPDTHRILESETVAAIPYYVSPKEIRHPSLVWNWFINDSPIIISGFKKNLMPLQVESGTSGISKLKLQIENRDKIFQTTSKEMIVEF